MAGLPNVHPTVWANRLLREPLINTFLMVCVETLEHFQSFVVFEADETNDALVGVSPRFAIEQVNASDGVDLLRRQSSGIFGLGVSHVLQKGLIVMFDRQGCFVRRTVPARTWRFIVLRR